MTNLAEQVSRAFRPAAQWYCGVCKKLTEIVGVPARCGECGL